MAERELPSFRPVFIPERLVAERTPVAAKDLGTALSKAWRELLSDTPLAEHSIYLLMAHWAFETGRGKSCYNYNLGNAKSVPSDGRCWVYRLCDEKLPSATARKLLKEAEDRK